tara:strand:+ start:67 stop:582 length:516 start_codon:yes stop_codon:yes gene_type:complete
MGTFPGGNMIRVTPTVIAGLTEDDDVMFDAMEIPNAVSSRGGVSKLTGITIIDNDGEQVDMDIIFMQVKTNFGTAGSPGSITDANLQAAKVIGAVAVDWTDHHVTFNQDANNASIWTSGGHDNTSTTMPFLVQAAGGSTSIYFTAFVADSGNADYLATDDLEFVFHFEYLG